MDKQDKQFEQLMKGMTLSSPSADFTHRVMGRIQAEAAVMPRKVLQNYQPVISRKTWGVLGVLCVALMVYITVSGSGTETAPGFWSNLLGSIEKVNSQEVGSVWQKGMTWFGSIPTVALLIVASTLVLYMLDTYLTRLRHRTEK
ncbi:MAG: hypothetical protein JNK09_19805 [Prolixibacteraceae bacterium]|nr:hypothetical protein [Prolixibacteraceae bacterium]